MVQVLSTHMEAELNAVEATPHLAAGRTPGEHRARGAGAMELRT